MRENISVVFPQTFIQKLLNRVDVVDVVGRYVQLKNGGANLMGLCPSHGEKSPSFSVSPTEQFYHCFGCGANGNATGFVMERAGMSFISFSCPCAHPHVPALVMSRPLRIEFEDAICHVTSRGDRREPIYKDDADRQAQLTVIAQAMERFDAQLLAYCLLGNHYHLVLHTGAGRQRRSRPSLRPAGHRFAKSPGP